MRNSALSCSCVLPAASSLAGSRCVSDFCYPHTDSEGKQNAQMSIEMNERPRTELVRHRVGPVLA